MILNNTLLELFLHIKSLTNTAYLVGGCVRDHLLGYIPKDFDIVTDVNLGALKGILIDNGWAINEVGKQFLVLVASKNSEQFEIALFRKEDSDVVGSVFTDYCKRDFTINSLYYDPFTSEFIDPSNKGLSDMLDKIIRFNGKPSLRIEEDSIRIFRAYRFSVQLGFTLDPKSLKACRTYFEYACKSSSQRILVEIEKMCFK